VKLTKNKHKTGKISKKTRLLSKKWWKFKRNKFGVTACGARIYFRIFAGEKILLQVSCIYLTLIAMITLIFFLLVPQAEVLAGRTLTIKEFLIGYYTIFKSFFIFFLIWFFSFIFGIMINVLKEYYYNFNKIYLKFWLLIFIPFLLLIGIGYGFKELNPDFFVAVDFNTFMNYLTFGWLVFYFLSLLSIIISWAFGSSADLYIKYARVNLKNYKTYYKEKLKIWHAIIIAYEQYKSSLNCLKDKELIKSTIDDLELNNLKLVVLEIDNKRKDYKTFNKKLRQNLIKLEKISTPLQDYNTFKSIMKSMKNDLIKKEIRLGGIVEKKEHRLSYYLIIVAFITAVLNLLYFIVKLI